MRREKTAEFKFIHRLGRTCSRNIGNIKWERVAAPVSGLQGTIKTEALQINNKSKGETVIRPRAAGSELISMFKRTVSPTTTTTVPLVYVYLKL